MKKLLIGISVIILAGIFITACDKTKNPQAPAMTALLGCETVTTELNILLPLRRDGKLPETAVKIIDQQRGITDPYCLGPAPDVNATYISIAIDGAARTLTAIAAQYNQ